MDKQLKKEYLFGNTNWKHFTHFILKKKKNTYFNHTQYVKTLALIYPLRPDFYPRNNFKSAVYDIFFFIYLLFYLSVYLFIYLFIYFYVYLFTYYLFILIKVEHKIRVSTWINVLLLFCLNVCLFLFRWVFSFNFLFDINLLLSS